MARKTMPERSPLNPKVLIMGGVLGFALVTRVRYSTALTTSIKQALKLPKGSGLQLPA